MRGAPGATRPDARRRAVRPGAASRGRGSSAGMGRREQTRAEFERMVKRPEPTLDLARAALLIAAENDPQVDVDAELQRIEGWANELKSRLDPSWNNLQKLARLRSFLYEELGF